MKDLLLVFIVFDMNEMEPNNGGPTIIGALTMPDRAVFVILTHSENYSQVIQIMEKDYGLPASHQSFCYILNVFRESNHLIDS